MSTAPAAMSLASFAIGSNDVDAMSTAASTAVLIISAIRTNAIASRSTISSILETSKASAAMRTATAMRKWIRMFRCVRSTWMIPSNAMLKLSMIEGGRRPGAGLTGRPGSEDLALAPFHLVAVPIPEQVQDPVHERPPPLLTDDRGADDDVAERPRDAFRQLVEAVDREREHVGRLVDAEVLGLERADLVGADERDPQLGVRHALGGERVTREGDRSGGVHFDAAPVRDLDFDHF